LILEDLLHSAKRTKIRKVSTSFAYQSLPDGCLLTQRSRTKESMTICNGREMRRYDEVVDEVSLTIFVQAASSNHVRISGLQVYYMVDFDNWVQLRNLAGCGENTGNLI
jgi:hypothetical protein